MTSLDVAADAGTTFDGEYLYQIAKSVIRKIRPSSGEVIAEIPAPHDGGNSGLAWAEGRLGCWTPSSPWSGSGTETKIRFLTVK